MQQMADGGRKGGSENFPKVPGKAARKRICARVKCNICNLMPDYPEAIALTENEQPYYTYRETAYLLCEVCERYYHLECYLGTLNLREAEREVDRSEFEQYKRFTCPSCRNPKAVESVLLT